MYSLISQKMGINWKYIGLHSPSRTCFATMAARRPSRLTSASRTKYQGGWSLATECIHLPSHFLQEFAISSLRAGRWKKVSLGDGARIRCSLRCTPLGRHLVHYPSIPLVVNGLESYDNISIILSHQRTVLEAHHLDAILSITQVSFDIEELESSNRMYPSSIHHSQYEFAISSSHRAELWKQASSGTCKRQTPVWNCPPFSLITPNSRSQTACWTHFNVG